MSGKIKNISSRYSPELFSIIKMMLALDPVNRPSVNELLRHPLLIPKLKQFKFNKYLKPEPNQELLGTIIVPENLANLKNKLP